jgi:hypothetical protein
MAYSRISITVPSELLKRLDQRAQSLDRPRSWVIAEAVRAWMASSTAVAGSAQVREPRSPGYGSAMTQNDRSLGDQRLAQLRADLALTPEQRVIAAEQTVKAVPAQSTRWSGVLSFERFEDFWAWKKREVAGR